MLVGHGGLRSWVGRLWKRTRLSARPDSVRPISGHHPGLRTSASVVVRSAVDPGSELHVAKEEVNSRAGVLVGLGFLNAGVRRGRPLGLLSRVPSGQSGEGSW